MQANQLLTADVLDIIFDGRNKSYGAYILRKYYNDRLLKAMLITGSMLIVMICIYFIVGRSEVQKGLPNINDVITILENPSVPPAEIPRMPLPPPAPSRPKEAIRTINNSAPVMVREADVKQTDMPPSETDLDNNKIGNINRDGALFDGTNEGPISDGITKGIVEAPKPNGTGDNGFIPIEIESEYPGGQPAWIRFLNKSLSNNYPADAIENRIQGTVIIQFVVDKDGTVSQIEAVSGPEELRSAAVTVIRKSGKWKPAIQNGRNVRSYKKQPISFMLLDQ